MQKEYDEYCKECARYNKIYGTSYDEMHPPLHRCGFMEPAKLNIDKILKQMEKEKNEN